MATASLPSTTIDAGCAARLVEIVPNGKLVNVLSTAGSSCAYGVVRRKSGSTRAALRAIERVDRACRRDRPTSQRPVIVGLTATQHALRRLGVRLVVVDRDAGGLDAVGNHFAPLVDEQACLRIVARRVPPAGVSRSTGSRRAARTRPDRRAGPARPPGYSMAIQCAFSSNGSCSGSSGSGVRSNDSCVGVQLVEQARPASRTAATPCSHSSTASRRQSAIGRPVAPPRPFAAA